MKHDQAPELHSIRAIEVLPKLTLDASHVSHARPPEGGWDFMGAGGHEVGVTKA
jgi:hypothetical protein